VLHIPVTQVQVRHPVRVRHRGRDDLPVDVVHVHGRAGEEVDDLDGGALEGVAGLIERRDRQREKHKP
jgi:hypothetical protein